MKYMISTNETHAQTQMNGLSKFCSPNQMLVNNIKTKFMVFGKSLKVNLTFNKNPIEEVSSYKCLGTIVNTIKTYKSDMFKLHPEYLCNKARKCVFSIQRKLKFIGDIPPKCRFHFFETMIKPILIYGSELWGTNINACESVDKIYRWYIRCVMRVKATTSNVISVGESGLLPPSVYCHIATILYAIRLNNMSDDNTLWKVFNESKRSHNMEFPSWYTKVSSLAESYNIDINAMSYTERDRLNIKSKIKRKFIDKWEDDVQNIRQFPIVRTYNLFKSKFGIANHLLHVKNSKLRNALSKIRCSSHTLNIERGRYTRPITPEHLRVCHLCKTIEDEKHFIIDCKLYDLDRKVLFDKVVRMYPSFTSLNGTQQFIFLFKCDDPQILTWLGKFVHESFLTRENNLI